jgi:hypothetical protein
MAAGVNRAGEHDLTNQDGTCLNKSRNGDATRSTFWTGWALENQSLGMGKDRPIHCIPWPTAGHAHSNSTQGSGPYLDTNPVMSMTDPLNAEARTLELDPKQYAMFPLPPCLPISDGAIRLRPASSTALRALPGYRNRLCGFALNEIADWVDANPGHVGYLKLDNDRGIGNEIQEMDDEWARYRHHRESRVSSGGQRRWPMLGEIPTARRLIIVEPLHQPSPVSSRWVWTAVGLGQEDDHPKDQNFDTRTTNGGLNPVQRGLTKPTLWWNGAEGQAKKDMGVFWKDNVEKATPCGVASIGLD